jgi:4'-phosphopantetheinyl transferase EntD
MLRKLRRRHRGVIGIAAPLEDLHTFFDAITLMYRVTTRLAAQYHQPADLDRIRALQVDYARAVEAHDALAMVELGTEAAAIPMGPDRAPQWPVGVVGSLTHCDGYRAAIVGWADVVLALGVDAEPHVALPAGVLELIARPDERSRLARLAAVSKGVRWDRLLFCVKESLYKAWFPMMKQWLDFQEAAVTFSIDDGPPSRQGGRFAAWLERPYTTSRGDRSVHMSGRWLARGGYLLAMTCIPGDVYANHET